MSAHDHFARLAASDPLYLAHAILCYQLSTGTDDAGLCALLGVEPDALTRLRCCGAVRPEHRDADLRAIAEQYGIEVGRLAEVVG